MPRIGSTSSDLLPRVLAMALFCYIKRALQIGSGLLIKLDLLPVALGTPDWTVGFLNRYGFRMGRVLCISHICIPFADGMSHSSWWFLSPLILNRIQVIINMWIITSTADPQANLHQLVTFCCHHIIVLTTSHDHISYCLQGNMLDVEIEIGGVRGLVYRGHISESEAQGAYIHYHVGTNQVQESETACK